MKSSPPPKKSRKEAYQEEYDASKAGGETFFPDTLVRDAIIGLIIVAAIIFLAIILPARSQPPADPTSTTYNPRPEWYFLFFFEFLKLFPGYLEPVAAVIIPTIAILILVLLPFLDRNPERHWSRRKYMMGVGVGVVGFLAVLEILGALSAPAQPAGEESPLVQAGRDVYNEINCSYCHSISGVGGAVGPDLSNVGSQLTETQMKAYLRNPDAMVPNTLHPKLLFTEDEFNALVAYLETLGAPVNYSELAPSLYAQHCASCHALNRVGGTAGPDLSGIGDRRTITFLESFIYDPATVLSGSTMPAFKNILTEQQIDDVGAYLANQHAAAPPTTSTTAPPTPTTTVTTTTTTVPPSAAPPIPHEIDDRENCLACHQTGAAGAPVVPADHAGRTNDICQSCHHTIPGLEDD